jgi:hypothetical protein
VHVHVAVAEAAAGRDVEVAHHLVDAQTALDAAPFVPLLVQLLAVVLALALLDALAPAEGPPLLRVGLPDLLARVAAPGLLRVAWGVGAAAGAAVGWVEMRRGLVLRMPAECLSMEGSGKRAGTQRTAQEPWSQCHHRPRSAAATLSLSHRAARRAAAPPRHP